MLRRCSGATLRRLPRAPPKIAACAPQRVPCIGRSNIGQQRLLVCKAVESKRDDDAESSGSFWEDDPGLRRNVSILIGSQIMLNIGVSQVVPVLPILATEMGLGATGIGMLMAAPAVARLALNLPYGRMADTIGRKPLMRWGTLATATGSIATGLLMHSGLAPVLASRLLVGAGTAASMTGSSAMMADITDAAPRHRTSIMALQSFVLSGVWVVGPVLGGLLAEAHGARNSFYLAGVGVGLCSSKPRSGSNPVLTALCPCR